MMKIDSLILKRVRILATYVVAFSGPVQFDRKVAVRRLPQKT